METRIVYNGVGYYYVCNNRQVTKTYSTLPRLRKYGIVALREYMQYWNNQH